MRTIDRCIFGTIAIGIWALIGAILLEPRPALSQGAALNSAISIAAEQISRLDCKLDGTSFNETISGDIKCHL
jgi:hypothetical protein